MTTPEKINRYEIKQELGRGGMATVYEAYDPQFQRPVAVKMLPREFLHDPEFRARFTREARTIAALEHPAIVPVYDFGEEDGQPFLVMRLMTGGSLTDRLEKGPLAIEQAAEILKRIGSALDRAHSQGIIHRDLKPSNILFDHYGDAFLADFGIARLTSASSQLTASGSLVGTPTYMSPEQVYGNKELDGRSDIYALGVILYQMLTGEIPFDADTPARMMMAHVMNPVPHLIDKRPDLVECDQLISKAMAKERDERFSTASDMSTALSEVTQKMKQPIITDSPTPIITAAVPPPLKIETPSVPAPVALPVADTVPVTPTPAAQDTAVSEPPPTPKPKPASSFDEPVYADDLVASAAAGGAKTPVWVWGVLGVLVFFCLIISVGGGFAVMNYLGKEDEVVETPTAVARTDQENGSTDTVFETLDGTATQTPTPMASPTTVPTATALPTDTAVANTDDPALATRESMAATRAAEAGNQTNNNNTTGVDVVATRESLEATRAAEIGTQPQNLYGDLDQVDPLFTVNEGDIPHDLTNDTIELFYPDVTAENFVLDSTFINPFSTDDGSWDVGIIFRQQEPDEELRLVVTSDGLWNLNNRSTDEDEFIQEGDVSDLLDLNPDQGNQLTLIVNGDIGYFFLNEEFVSILDLSSRSDAGDIAIGTGFYTVDEQEGAVTTYEDFGVWPLETVFGPEDGELVHVLDDLVKLAEAGINERNVLISATFGNPFAAEENDFDFGFSFRDDDDGTKYWLVIGSEGEWELVRRLGDSDTDTTLQSGDIDNLNLGENEENEVVVIVWGDTGYFFVNGEFIEQLDLFDITDSGDAEIITAFYFDHELEDEATSYSDFTIWPLP